MAAAQEVDSRPRQPRSVLGVTLVVLLDVKTPKEWSRDLPAALLEAEVHFIDGLAIIKTPGKCSARVGEGQSSFWVSLSLFCDTCQQPLLLLRRMCATMARAAHCS
jgi:hypothetical protein